MIENKTIKPVQFDVRKGTPIKPVQTERGFIEDGLIDLFVSFADGDLGEYASEINECIDRCWAHNHSKIAEDARWKKYGFKGAPSR